ncbi:MAG: GFA family protein [Sphingobium sp.]|nr:GFA family protein [Sphingobium sp.]
MTSGGCQCGAIRYTVRGEAGHKSLCYCGDCRKSSGAPVVGWMLFEQDQVEISGSPVSYKSSDHGERQFCGQCGSSLFYLSETVFPGQVDITIASLDDPAAFPPEARIQLADAPEWARHMDELPGFERYPGM